MRVISGVDLVEDLGKKLQPAPAQTSQLSAMFSPFTSKKKHGVSLARGNSKVFHCQQTYLAAFSSE